MANSRRQFLKSAAGLSSLALTSCASLDSFFTADKNDYEKEVFIIGGGAAGLMAAHTLKKNRIPFRLFEASARPGGRLYTVYGNDGTALEMGAEFFESHHRLVFELLKEFQLEWEEIISDPMQQPMWRSTNGQFLTDVEYQKVSAAFIQKMIQTRLQVFGTSDTYQILSPLMAKELDSLSISQFLNAHWIQPDDRVAQYWEAWSRAQYSAESTKVSALKWIWDQQPDRKTKSLYKVLGGWEKLNSILYDRVAGVIPDHLIKMRWALAGIRKTNRGFRCAFRTPKGLQVLETQNLICAIPVNQYVKIDGFMDLDIQDEKKSALRNLSLGEGSKIFIGFKQGQISVDELSQFPFLLRDQVQMFYQKGASHDWVGGLRGGLQSQWTLPDIENWKAGLTQSEIKEGQFDFHVVNWKDRPYIQGSRSVWAPGQWGPYTTLFENSDYGNHLQWAGEHVPATEKGNVHAALLSGQKAALKIMEAVKNV